MRADAIEPIIAAAPDAKFPWVSNGLPPPELSLTSVCELPSEEDVAEAVSG